MSAYIKAFLVRIKEGLIYTEQLRHYLIKHPLLVIDLGFHLHLDPTAAYGFDVEHTLPSRYWLGEKLRQLDRTLLQDLLAATVGALKEEIPGLSEVVAFDVKHIYAWVKENNSRAYVKDRYDKTQILAGDPDCKLGVKRSTNKELPDGTSRARKRNCFGAMAAAWLLPPPQIMAMSYSPNTPNTRNEGDITYFRPLHQQAVVTLQDFPTHLTADAAYDAWYVYEAAVRHSGIAAVPLNARTNTIFDKDGVPRCPIGLRMHPTYRYAHPYGYHAERLSLPASLS